MKKLFVVSALVVSSVVAVQATTATKSAAPQKAAVTTQPAAKSALPVVKGAKSLSGAQKGQVNGGAMRWG